jgi:hypothetical protein
VPNVSNSSGGLASNTLPELEAEGWEGLDAVPSFPYIPFPSQLDVSLPWLAPYSFGLAPLSLQGPEPFQFQPLPEHLLPSSSDNSFAVPLPLDLGALPATSQPRLNLHLAAPPGPFNSGQQLFQVPANQNPAPANEPTLNPQPSRATPRFSYALNCGRVFTTKRRMQDHLRSGAHTSNEHRPWKFQCGGCEKKWDRRDNYICHLRTCRGDLGSVYVCKNMHEGEHRTANNEEHEGHIRGCNRRTGRRKRVGKDDQGCM